MGRVTVRRRLVAVERSGPGAPCRAVGRMDRLAVEEPLEVRVGGAAYTTTMRTPGHDVELAHGLLAAEGIIDAAQDVATARYCAGSVVDDEAGAPQNTYNLLDVGLAGGVVVPPERRRSLLTTSACGVCGTASIELLTARRPYDLTVDDLPVPAELILALPDRLRTAQKTFETTGGLHAAGLFTAAGELLVAREDVGRHNAVDKVVGWAMLNGHRPGRGLILQVSGRTSYELAQKAVMAGIPVLAGVSAPSSLAVEVAEATGLTLAGFVRGDRMNVYAGAHRISTEADPGGPADAEEDR
ncbi:MAG: formate dehydrogenase accessory sulfurtransferase FdhD [Austwickia sp.]|nr:MAG: formate dehydrogenase accessory sulfurtransferase FdhD [Austwickia sp.]